MPAVLLVNCPDCGSPMRDDGFNRLGWYYGECGRRYNPRLGLWDAGLAATGCLRRRLDRAVTLLAQPRPATINGSLILRLRTRRETEGWLKDSRRLLAVELRKR